MGQLKTAVDATVVRLGELGDGARPFTFWAEPYGSDIETFLGRRQFG